MKKNTFIAISILIVFWSSACTNSASNETNSANSAPPTTTENTTNSEPTKAENTRTNTAIVPKMDDTESAKTSTSEPSESKPGGTRVQFAKGETSTMVTKDIPAEGSVDFLINVQKGQTMGYTVGYDFKDSDIKAFLTEPGLQDISQTAGPKEPKEFTINKSGDHRLTVNNTTKKKVTITLYLDIQ